MATAEENVTPTSAGADEEGELAGRRWRELMLRSPFGIAIYHPDGSVKEANEHLRRIFELTVEEAQLALSSYNLLDDAILESHGIQDEVRQVFDGRACRLPRLPYELLTPLTKRRVLKWLQGVIFPVHDPQGVLQEVIAVQLDVTRLEKAESEAALSRQELTRRLAEMQRLEQHYRELFENAPVMYAVTRVSAGEPAVADCNKLFLQTLAYKKDEVLGRPLANFYSPGSKEELLKGGGYQSALDGAFQTSERELVTKNGDLVTAVLFAAPDVDRQGAVIGTRAMFVDISATEKAQKELAESESKYRALFEEAMDAVFLTTRSGRWIDANPAAVSLFGFESREELLETQIAADLYQNPEDRTKLTRILERQGFVRDYELRLKTSQGHPLTVVESSRAIRGRDGSVLGYHGILHDVTERRDLEKKLEHQAYHDSLTGLPNRAKLHLDFAEIVGNEAADTQFAVVLFDLDRFKEINDALGHQMGDRMLKKIGPRIRSMTGIPPLRFYRLGGDEFSLLIGPLAGVDEAVEVTSRLLEELRRPMVVDGLSLEIGASAGVATRPSDGSTSGELLRCADVAMYVAKRTAAGVVRYRRDLDPHSPQRLQLMAELRQALSKQQLVMHYQPKIRLKDESLVGFEALVRWAHPTRGLMVAGDFIPLAEFGNLIHQLTYWVTREALAQLHRWSGRWPDSTMAVNLSTRVLIDSSSAGRLARIVAESGVDPGRVEFEVTETALMTDASVAMTTLSKLAAAGVRIAVDDFGTGYSSLSHLKEGFIRTLKIDRSFVNDMLKNELSSAIVDATIRMSRDMNLMSVAEGVEDEATRLALVELGCGVAQGYHFARPCPPEEIERELRFR